MIGPGGTFDYSVTVERDTCTQPRWIGRAHSLRDSSSHPGRAGKQPLFELEGSQIILRATESKIRLLTNRHFRRWGRPADCVSFEIGSTPAAILQAGDQLAFHRLGTGDHALTVIRKGSLVLGVGSIIRLPLGRDLQVEDDARINELQLYELANEIDRLKDIESQVFWIEVGKGDLEAQLELMNHIPEDDNLIVALKGGEQEAVFNLLERIMDRTENHSGSFHVVDARFATKQDWLDYINQLPREYPNDLQLSIATGQERINLGEGEEAQIGLYYVRVERVYRRGIPGELSSLGIGPLSSVLTKDMIIESAKHMACLK